MDIYTETLADYFESQASWRYDKAEEYPEDERNQTAADALGDLEHWLREQDSDSDSQLERFAHFARVCDSYGLDGVECLKGAANGSRVASRFRFDGPETVQSFLARYLYELKRDITDMMDAIVPPTHANDCVAEGNEDVECEPLAGEWSQPEGYWVKEVVDMFGEPPVWCQLRKAAWFLQELDEV